MCDKLAPIEYPNWAHNAFELTSREGAEYLSKRDEVGTGAMNFLAPGLSGQRANTIQSTFQNWRLCWVLIGIYVVLSGSSSPVAAVSVFYCS